MKRLLFCLIFLIRFPIYAQDASWPPDLENALGTNVQVQSVETVPPPPEYPSPASYNPVTQEIIFYDEESDSMISLPYPEGIESLVGIRQDGETIILMPETNPASHLFMNLSTGETWQPELMCGEYRAAAGEGNWIVPIFEDESLELNICHTETGERIFLPTEAGDIELRGLLVLSPDQQRGILIGNDGFYVFRFADASLTNLGGDTSYYYQDIWWMGNESIIVSQTNMGDMMFPWVSYSLADVTVAHSLRFITGTEKPARIRQLENPARVEWVESSPEGCILYQMHVETGQLDEYALGTVCDSGWTIPNSQDRIYVSLETEPIADDCEGEGCYTLFRPVSRKIIRFSLSTGEEQLLIEGEIENLMSISNDGKYGVLLLDDNGQIDMIDAYSQYLSIEDLPINFRYAVIDLLTGEILYETPTSSERSWGDFWYDSISDDNTVAEAYSVWGPMLAGARDSFYYIGSDSFIFKQLGEDWSVRTYRLIQLRESIIETEIGRPMLVTLDDRFLVQIGTNGTESEIQRLDLETGQIQTILRLEGFVDAGWNLVFRDFPIQLHESIEPDSLRIQFYNRDTGESIIYTLLISDNT